ncbi:MAG: Maf family protein [Akkermansiaceae bacterium]
MKPIILASSSPRRRDLLAATGLEFQIIPSSADEIHDASIPLHLLCESNAEIKALDIAKNHPDAIVIGADTLVYIDQTPLGKPRSESEARETLMKLSGRAHQVCTGVCIAEANQSTRFHQITQVIFKKLTPADIDNYMQKVNVMDKAGSYALQEHGELIVDEVIGDYNNVVGFPIELVLAKLQETSRLAPDHANGVQPHA